MFRLAVTTAGVVALLTGMYLTMLLLSPALVRPWYVLHILIIRFVTIFANNIPREVATKVP